MSSKSFGFSNFCRTCAKESSELQSLYHFTENDKTFAEMIKICTQISFYKFELRPKVICKDCVMKLNAAYEFYHLVRSSEEKFKTMVSSQIFTKSETGTNEDMKDSKLANRVHVVVQRKIEKEPVEMTKSIFEPETEIIERAEDIFVAEMCANRPNGERERPFTFADHRFDRKCKYNHGRSTKPDKKPIASKKRKIDVHRPYAEFECYKCKKSFPSHFKVQVHLREHDATRKCRVCLKEFTQYEFIKHLCDGTEIKCQYCSKPFQSTHTLVKHINGNHKDHPNYKCYDCAKAFPSKTLLEIHKPIHDGEEKIFVCDICGSRYRTRFQIKEHMETKHSDKRSIFPIIS